MSDVKDGVGLSRLELKMSTPTSPPATRALRRRSSTTPKMTAWDSSRAVRRHMSTGTLISDAGKWVCSPSPDRSSIRFWNAMLSSLNRPHRPKWAIVLARDASCDAPATYPDRSTRYTGRGRDTAYAHAATAAAQQATATAAGLCCSPSFSRPPGRFHDSRGATRKTTTPTRTSWMTRRRLITAICFVLALRAAPYYIYGDRYDLARWSMEE
uniref:Uncharacterized protein n=1 Tax=Zea mays TaxID=4577 RepID=C4J5E4_MAIZE|nr:unknown [Zea mays]